MKSPSRREVIVGLGAAMLAGKAEAKPKQERLEHHEDAQEQHAALMELWYTPQDQFEGHSLAEMTDDLREYFGEWYVPFNTINQIGRMRHLVDKLADDDRHSPAWSKPDGAASHLSRLYESYWDSAAVHEEIEHEAIPQLEHPEHAGIDEPTAVALLAPGAFLPKGWLGSVRTVRWQPKPLRTPFLPGNVAAGMALPTVDSYVSDRNQRNISMVSRDSTLDKRPDIMTTYITFLHEFAHANDWDTGNFTADFKIYMYWKTMQLLESLPEDSLNQVENFQYQTLQREAKRNNFHRWRAVMEFWPELFTDYMARQDQMPEHIEFVERVIQETDPTFNRETAMKHGRDVLLPIALRRLDQRASEISDAASISIWQDQRRRYETGSPLLELDRGTLRSDLWILLDNLDTLYDPDQFWLGYAH